MLGMRARRVEEARIAVVPVDEPQSGILDAKRVKPIENRHAGGVERGKPRRQAGLANMAHDRVEQIDDLPDGRRQRVGRERNALCSRVSLHSFPRDRILVVVHERLHEELVAEQSPIDDLVRLGRAHDVVTPRAGARLDLRLRRDELRRLDVELLRSGLDADAREIDLAARTGALGSGNEEHVGDAGQVRRQRGTGVRRGLLGAALLRQPLLCGGGPPVIGRRGAEERQLHLQAPHRFAGRVLSRLARELLHELRVEVAHLHE
jgi:hypothetical protein